MSNKKEKKKKVEGGGRGGGERVATVEKGEVEEGEWEEKKNAPISENSHSH